MSSRLSKPSQATVTLSLLSYAVLNWRCSSSCQIDAWDLSLNHNVAQPLIPFLFEGIVVHMLKKVMPRRLQVYKAQWVSL